MALMITVFRGGSAGRSSDSKFPPMHASETSTINPSKSALQSYFCFEVFQGRCDASDPSFQFHLQTPTEILHLFFLCRRSLSDIEHPIFETVRSKLIQRCRRFSSAAVCPSGTSGCHGEILVAPAHCKNLRRIPQPHRAHLFPGGDVVRFSRVSNTGEEGYLG